MRYHGSKFRIAPWIISHFPPHDIYVEPYGGGASVLMRKPRACSEVYNDIDNDIVNVFQVLRSGKYSARLIDLLRLTPYSKTEFHQAYEPTECPVEQARRTLIRAHMGFGSAGATKNNTGFRCDSTRTNATAATCWMRYPDHVASFIERMRGVLIDCRPALDAINQHDGDKALFYVDPPYLESTRTVKKGSPAYRHEMDESDHIALLNKLKTVAGMVVLSGYENDMYNDLLTGWNKKSIHTKSSGNRGAVNRIETLWLSPRCTLAQRQIELIGAV